MRIASLCDGIGTAHIAGRSIGWVPVASSEIDPVCRAVVSHHFPEVQHIGDMSDPRIVDTLGELRPQVLMASTPCQAFSTIGHRRSLSDERGNLTLALVGIAQHVRPQWLVWENVPGVLSTKDNAFGHFLAGLIGSDTPLVPPKGGWPTAGAAEGVNCRLAWRVIDSQGFVPQRRRRVFVVASRDGRDPVRVLFENAERAPDIRAVGHWVKEAIDLPEMPIVFDWQAAGAGNDESFRGKSRRWIVRAPGMVGTLNTCRVDAILVGDVVRKLTSNETQRLMGFPDGYLDAPLYAGKPISTAKKYKMCGNSIVVPVLRWLYKNIKLEEARVRSMMRMAA